MDGINGELAGFGGIFGGQQYDGGMGSLSVPLGCEWRPDRWRRRGFRRALSRHRRRPFVLRNPAQGLLGAYGDFTQWNEFGGVRAAHRAPEAEWYNGRLTVAGVAGLEVGNAQSGTVGTVIQTFSVPTRFFDQINLAYYPLDNLQVYAGHRYLDGGNALARGGEWGVPMSHGVMSALFVEGRVGDGAYHGVWGGLRVYFGRTDKTLIRRHREDDPTNWNDGAASTYNNGSQTSAPPTMTCPPGEHLVGGHCVGL